MTLLQLFLKYLKGLRLRMVSLFGIVISYVSLTLISPLLFAFLIDNVINLEPITTNWLIWYSNLFGGVDRIRTHLWLAALMIIAVNLIIFVLMYLRGRLNGVISERYVEKLRNDLFKHLQYFPYHAHVNAKSGDLIQRCTSDVDTIRRFLAGQVAELVYATSMAIIAMIILLQINLRLALISMISLPFLVIFAYVFFMRMQKVFTSSDEAEGELSTVLQESLSGVRVVKAFNREVFELKKFDEKNSKYKNLTYKLIELLGIYWASSDLVVLTQIFVVVIFGIYAAQAGEISVGQFFVFLSYESMILWPIRNIGRILSDLGKMMVSLRRLKEIFDEPMEDIESGDIVDIKGDIVFEHVRFQYEDGNQPVLEDVSFTIKEGETLAILGPTGSGKSSLVHLLTRLYDYNSGSIKLNGHELNTIQKKHLRHNIGIVLQEPFLFSKTILENIRLAQPNADENAVKKAAEMAAVHRVIHEFDLGYKTLVGEKGVTLSGGQKQRIAIARTILNQTPILIFDDSLSAVDTHTDEKIRHALKERAAGVTTLIITHRVASAMQADKIIILENGKISQQGTHASLSEQDGLYRRIVTIQSQMIEGGEEDE
ncbi:MAG TPA: ABC transporter ATP-binding protein [Erysipelotrichaceae bacterium]|nr:ABC transporter ATP-binding protein [Erysipelotrichaceae bacterium]